MHGIESAVMSHACCFLQKLYSIYSDDSARYLPLAFPPVMLDNISLLHFDTFLRALFVAPDYMKCELMLDRPMQVATKVEEGVKQLVQAEKTQKQSRTILCIVFLLVAVIFMLFIVVFKAIFF